MQEQERETDSCNCSVEMFSVFTPPAVHSKSACCPSYLQWCPSIARNLSGCNQSKCSAAGFHGGTQYIYIYDSREPGNSPHSPVYDCHEVNYPERGPEEEISRGWEDLYEVREAGAGGARHCPPPLLSTAEH